MAITLTTWYVKGLRSPTKRTKIVSHLKKLKTDIALLQETHMGEQDFHRMRKGWVGEVLGSPGKEKSRSDISEKKHTLYKRYKK